MEIGDRTSAFGSGGMRSKVAAAEMAAESGIPATICNGTKERHPAGGRAGASRSGTALRGSGRARRPASSSGSSTPSRPRDGSTVDDGAARVLRESGSSLLPVGITAVDGSFEVGDAVEVAADGRRLRQGHRRLFRHGAHAGDGSRRAMRCASCCRTRRTRSSTGIASSCSERRVSVPKHSSEAPAERFGRGTRRSRLPLAVMAVTTTSVAETLCGRTAGSEDSLGCR